MGLLSTFISICTSMFFVQSLCVIVSHACLISSDGEDRLTLYIVAN